MDQKKGMSGCSIAAIIFGVLFAIAVLCGVLVFRGFMKVTENSRDHAKEQAELIDAQYAKLRDGYIEFDHNDWPELPPLEKGGTVSIERYLLWKMDDNLTSLAREGFVERANGSHVKWPMVVDDIRERDSGINGNFSVPYMVRDGNRATGSSIYLHVEFAAGQEDALINLKRDQWVTIEGDLELTEGDARIVNSRLADKLVK